MKVSYLLGIVCGIVVGLVCLVVLMKMTRTDGSMKCKYDERQMIVRATGFKYGFFTLLIYDLVYGCLVSAMEKRLVDDLTGMFIGCCLSVLVYSAYAIWNEGYYSLNENPKRMLWVFGIVAFFNLVVGVRNLLSEGIFKDGMLTSNCMNLICAITFIIIFVIFFIKWRVSKGEAD